MPNLNSTSGRRRYATYMIKKEVYTDTNIVGMADSEGGWEDVDSNEKDTGPEQEENLSDTDTMSITESPTKAAARRRKVKTHPVGISQRLHSSTRLKRIQNERTTVSESSRVVANSLPYDDIKAALISGSIACIKFITEVIAQAVKWSKKPLALLLMLWISTFVLGQLSTTVRSTLEPLCTVFPISKTPICLHLRPANAGARADYPRMMDMQTKTFEQILEDTVSSTNTAIDIRKAEIATRDLITVVKISQLSAKEILAAALADFVADAKDTANGLHSLNAKADGAVDRILAVNDHALRQIEAAKASEKSSNSLAKYIWPSAKDANEVVAATFHNAMNILSATFSKLIIEAEIHLRNLEKLEERLQIIHDILVQEDATYSAELDDVLALLWTKLGGNRRVVDGINENLALLRNIGAYRKQALAHVTRVYFAMKKVSASLEELRDTVSVSGILGEDIPLEAHVESIKRGLERLKTDQLGTQQRKKDIEKKYIESFSS